MPRTRPESLNPYQNRPRHELARLAWGIVEELGQARKRTADERRDLARRTAWLLRAYLWLSHGSDMLVLDLQQGRGRLADRFMEYYLSEERYLRYAIRKEAEAYVLGDPAEHLRWSLDTRVNDKSLAQHVYDGAAGLRVALDVLEGIWEKQRSGDGP